MRHGERGPRRGPVIGAIVVAVCGLAGWTVLLNSRPPTAWPKPPVAANVTTPAATSYYALTHAPRIARQSTAGLMLGVYTQDLAEFDQAVGHPAGLIVRYLHWGSAFPAVPVVGAAGLHAETVLEIEPNQSGRPTATQIAQGKGDAWLRHFGVSIAGYGDPVVISFEPEMNGLWHQRPWHEDARSYVAAFRHIHTVLSRTAASSLITWLWQPSAIHIHTPNPMPWWPGSKYVDVVGLDGYYYFPSDTFSGIFAKTISLVRHRTKLPILVGETAVGPQSKHQAWGIRNLFSGVGQYGLIGLIWYDQRQNGLPYHQDWRLEDTHAAMASFRSELNAHKLATFPTIGPKA